MDKQDTEKVQKSLDAIGNFGENIGSNINKAASRILKFGKIIGCIVGGGIIVLIAGISTGLSNNNERHKK